FSWTFVVGSYTVAGESTRFGYTRVGKLVRVSREEMLPCTTLHGCLRPSRISLCQVGSYNVMLSVDYGDESVGSVSGRSYIPVFQIRMEKMKGVKRLPL
ncbi:hypothetical protein BHE74_00053022, partial [Ensete ventricosum]